MPFAPIAGCRRYIPEPACPRSSTGRSDSARDDAAPVLRFERVNAF